jgi:hypothetical protein
MFLGYNVRVIKGVHLVAMGMSNAFLFEGDAID